MTDRDLAAGAVVRLGVLLPRACKGTARGRVQLKQLDESARDPASSVLAPGRTVGRFSVRLP
jgi:hypothetical protein